MYSVQGSSVLSICVKPGVSATYWTMTDLVPAGLLVYWTVTDLVPAHLVVFNTGELTQIEAAGQVSSLPPQVLDICPPGLVMDPNWVIHYKVVHSWRQLTSLSLWEGVRFGGYFVIWGNFLVVCGRLKFMWVVHLHFSILWLFLLIYIQ